MRHAALGVVACALVACGGDAGAPIKSGASVDTDMQMVMFGAVAAGTTSTQHLAIHSAGTSSLQIRSLTITDDARGAFSLGGLPVTIVPGGVATLDVTYTAAGAPTMDTGTLQLVTNADNSPILQVSLFGTTVAGPVPITVTLAGDGGGTVSSSPLGITCGTACTASFSPGTMVTLSAVADNGSAFTGFSGACTGMTCTIDVTAAATVTATFVKAYQLSISSSGNGDGTVTGGGLNCAITAGLGTGVCAIQVPEGTVVPIAATPVAGSRFGAFSGACTSAPCAPAVTIDENVGVTFVLQHTVTVTLTGDGGGTVTSTPSGISCAPTCSFDFDDGSMPSFTALDDGMSHFTGFGGACSGATCQPTVNSPLAITANFVKLQTLTVTAIGSGSGTVSGSGISCVITAGATSGTCSASVAEGASVNLSETIGGSTRFGGFGNACTGASCSFTMPTGPATVTAQFVRQYTVAVTLAGGGSGSVSSTPSGISCPGTCSAPFDELSTVSLTATPTGSDTYAYSVDCSGTSCSFASLAQSENVITTFSLSATYSIGGTVTGLSSALTLSNNGTFLPLSSNGTFAFTAQPASYSVSVSTQPSSPAQTCSVTNGSGTASGAVTNIQIDCPPFKVASGLDHPGTLTRNGSTLYFARGLPPGVADCYSATGAGDAVMLVPADGSSAPTKIADVDHSGGNCGVYGLVFDSTYVYWANYADGVIKKATLAGTGVTPVYSGPTYLNALAIDPTGGYLYYFAYSLGQIGRITTLGTLPQEFAAITSINAINMATDSSYLYWTDGIAGTVNKLAFAASPLPGTPTQIAPSEAGAIAPYVTASTIYWLTSGAGGLLRYSPLASPNPQTLASSLPTPGSVVVDATYAYVLVNGTAPNYTDGAILKVPLAGGPAVTIASSQYQPQALVMDATHLYWTVNSTAGNSDGAILMIVK